MNNDWIDYVIKNKEYIIFTSGGRFFIFFARYSSLLELDKNECFEGGLSNFRLKADFLKKLDALAECPGSSGALNNIISNKTLLKNYNGGLRPAASALNLDLTPLCNLDCVYCYAKGGDYETQERTMSVETVRSAVIEAAGAGTLDRSRKFRFEFFGGEPFLNRRVIEETLEFERAESSLFERENDQSGARKVSANPVINRISTNLTVFDDNILKTLTEGDFIVSISIDGTGATQNAQRPYKNGGGSYDDIVENVGKLKKAAPNIKTVARMTVYSSPERFLDELKEIVALNLFDYCSVYCAATDDKGGGDLAVSSEFISSYKRMAAEYGWLLSIEGNIFKGCLELNRYIRYLTDASFTANHCRAGRGYFTLAPDGSVYPCHRLIGKAGFKIEGGLKNISAADSAWRASVDERETCSACPLRYICGGGCKQEALVTGGSLLSANLKICDFANLLFESALIAIANAGAENLKKAVPSSDELSDLFVLCGRDTIKSDPDAQKSLREILIGYICVSGLVMFLISFLASLAFSAVSFFPLFCKASPASACPGTNEPWHELSIESMGTTYLEAGYFTSYGEADGLAAKSVKCLAWSQKRKLLFIGSKENGVILFDGKYFSPLVTVPPLPSPNILSICYSAADDRLLVGTNAGLAIVSGPTPNSSAAAAVVNLKNSDILSDTIYSLACDTGGTVYAGTDHGFFTVFSGTLRKVANKTSTGVELGRVNSIYAGANNQIYIATDLAVLKTSDCNKFEPDDLATGNRANGATKISKLTVPAPAGPDTAEIKIDEDIAFSSSLGLTISTAGGRAVNLGVNEGLPENWVSCFGCDSYAQEANKAQINVDARLAGKKSDDEPFDADALMKKLSKFASPDTQITREGDSVILKTRDMQSLLGNVDFVAVNDAYNLFNLIQKVPAPKNPALESLKSGLWIGTNNSGLAVYNGSEFVVFNKDNSPLTSNRITDILCCPEFVYIATDGGGLVRYGQYDAPSPGAEVEKILNGKQEFIKAYGSDIYMGGKSGLYHYNLIDSTCEIMPEKPELKNLRSFCADDKGVFYLASGDAGVVKLSGKYKDPKTNKYRFTSLATVSKKDGTPGGACSCVYYIENKGVIAGFSEISCKTSEKCVIISPDGKIAAYAPQGGATSADYDTTQPTLAAPAAFLALDESVITGLGEGGSNALVFFSGSLWQYMTTPLSCVFARIDSINRGRGGEIYIAGDSGAAVFNGREWKRIDNNGGVAITDSVCAMKDTLSDGVWILKKHASGTNIAQSSVLTYGSKNVSYSKVLEGTGVSFAQLDPYIFVATTKGVYKIKKK